jgi:hypothetical protein
VAKGHAQQFAYQRTLAVKQFLCLQCGPSPHHVEISNPFQFLPTEKRIGSEDFVTVPR